MRRAHQTLILRSLRSKRLEGWTQRRDSRPSFETRARRAPQDEVGDAIVVAGRRRYALIALPDRLQPGFDLRAARFQKRRQRQFLAERFQGLVGRKTRSIGGDLVQVAVG